MAFRAFNFGDKIGIVGQRPVETADSIHEIHTISSISPRETASPDLAGGGLGQTPADELPPIVGYRESQKGHCPPGSQYRVIGSTTRKFEYESDPGIDNPLDPNRRTGWETVDLYGCIPQTSQAHGGSNLGGFYLQPYGGGSGGSYIPVPDGTPAWARDLWLKGPLYAPIFNLNAAFSPTIDQRNKIVDAFRKIVRMPCIKDFPELENCLANIINGTGKKIGVPKNRKERNAAIDTDQYVNVKRLRAYYDESLRSIMLSGSNRDMFGDDPSSEFALRSVLLHEILHACLDQLSEIEIEILEQYCFPYLAEVNRNYIKGAWASFSPGRDQDKTYATEPCWTPDGELLFVTERVIWNPKTGEVWLNKGTKGIETSFPIKGSKIMGENSPFMITDPGLLKKFYPDNLDELKDEFGDCIVRS